MNSDCMLRGAPRGWPALWSLILATLCLLTSRLNAQLPFSNACLDRRGQPIAGVVDNTIPWGAEATMQDGHRVIIWNQHALAGFSRTAQLFVYLHECAHHTLNHLSHAEDDLTIETQADCWAIQLMADGGIVNGSTLVELTHELRSMRGDVNHLGGDALLASLQLCLDVRTDQQAWDSSLSILTAAASDSFHSVRGAKVEDADSGIFQARQGAPGTFDCEVLGSAAVRCMIFAAKKHKAAEKRYTELMALLRHWLSDSWTATERVAPSSDIAEEFLAQDTDTGTLIVLALKAEPRLYFLVKAQPAK